MVNLRIFSLHNSEQATGLMGPLRDFGKAVYLKELRLEGNRFDGTIPPSLLLFSNVTDELVTINLSNNKLTGSVPLSLLKFDSLNLDISGNQLDIPLNEKFCTKKAWTGGAVEQYGCDAIVCPAGKYLPEVGKVEDDDAGECKDCPDNNFLGATSCAGGSDNPSTPFVFSEWMILATVYRELNGPKSWNNTEGWNQVDEALDFMNNTTLASHPGMEVEACEWYGVTCENNEITEIDLMDNGLLGTVPAILFAMTALTHLDLSHNSIDLSKSAKVKNSKVLESLDLSSTKITSLKSLKDPQPTLSKLRLNSLKDLEDSKFPGELLSLTNLRLLHMQHSKLTGKLPTELGDLMKIKSLKLFGNAFTGTLPTELGLMVELQELELSENQFTGTINSHMMNKWKSIKSIHIHNSVKDFTSEMKGFTGSIPALDELPLLEEVSFDFHSFSGSIPSTFLNGVKDKNKEISVSAGYNQLTGTVPQELKVFKEMILELAGNKISKIDPALCQLKGWMHGQVGELLDKAGDVDPCDAILCSKNTFNPTGKGGTNTTCIACAENDDFLGHTWCGSVADEINSIVVDKQILDLLYKKTGGRYWKKQDGWNEPNTHYCNYTGVSCDSEDKVDQLDLIGFGLQGTVPFAIFTLEKLRLLALTNNDKVDISFSSLGLAKNLITLKLSNTHVRSLESLDQGASTRMTELHLAGNQLTGAFPTQLLKLTTLKQVFLNNNMFNGTLPTAIGDMNNLEALHMAGNQLSGPMPEEIGKLSNLVNLDFASNSLSGNLPTSMNELVKLGSILLKDQQSANKLGGPLLAFSQVNSLSELDLSYNAFSGSIPENFLDDLDGSRPNIRIDLSFNEITGKVPATLSKFSNTNFFLNLAENQITFIDPTLCPADSKWMDGDVAALDKDRCNAILCPAGTAAPDGRQTDLDQPCSPCKLQLVDAPYFGATKCSSHTSISESVLLEQFFDKTNGTSWARQRNWKSDRDLCTWHGITCNADGAVKEIDLSGNGLKASGDVSSLLWDLKSLEVLNVKSNDISLTFQGLDAEESSLKELHLSATGLKSVEGLSVLSDQLTALHITDNSITGAFPSDILQLTKLEKLYMSFNDYSGELPNNLGVFSNLQEFYAYSNSFTGPLPSNTELAKMSKMVEFIIPSNKLDGTIPSQFSNMPLLEQLSLYDQRSNGKLTGTLPNFVNSPKLWYFDVTSNAITGTIPESFMKNSEYFDSTDFDISIDLANNELTGGIPEELAKFSSMTLDITGNSITKIPYKFCNIDGWMQGMVGVLKDTQGADPCDAIACAPGTYAPHGKQEDAKDSCKVCESSNEKTTFGKTMCYTTQSEKDILTELYLLTGGEEWENDDNWNTDEPLCSWYGIKCFSDKDTDNEGVSEINLENNNLVGSVPSWIWSLPFLRILDVKENDVVIDFLGLENAANTLEVLYLSETNLDTLYGISQASSLKELHITNCGISGPLPTELFSLGSTLKSLFIAYNSFTGTIPAGISQMTVLEDFYAYDNDFQGVLPTELGHLRMLKNFIMSENLIEGQLPFSLSELANLKLLSIYRRFKPGPKLTGALPAFDKNPQLRKLYLDHNEIAGTIPDNFLSSSTINEVKEILLSYNMLTGTVPESLDALTKLDMELEGNLLKGFSDKFCDNGDWMGGNIITESCDAFLCPKETYAPDGRQTVTTVNETGSDCLPCEDNNPVLVGQTTCETKVDERKILTNLHQRMGGSDWFNKTNWATPDVCTWYGIECNDVDQVTHIRLSSNNLVGTPNPELFTLPKLKTVEFSFNPTNNMEFGEELAQATSLTTLKVDATRLKSLNGLHHAPSLMVLDVSFNALTDEFPKSFSQLSNLRTLNMAYNQLGGRLPTDIWDNFKYLRTLRLDHNTFSGNLPTFATNVALVELDLSYNKLTGVIPEAFFTGATRTNGYRIDLASNQFRGTLPAPLATLDFVQLYARDNQFTALHQQFCDRYGWFEGTSVRSYGCDAILCPPGTYNFPTGRAVDEPCRTCLDKTEQYYGQSYCNNPGSGSVTFGVVTSLFVLVVGWLVAL
mmetsp:Transcript_4343/g.6736  ORF Transcript_4343/g.6736 Transcript_4343/m.6736 type:complete len:2041 (+) Transcript_4343:1014-7136(+)